MNLCNETTTMLGKIEDLSCGLNKGHSGSHEGRNSWGKIVWSNREENTKAVTVWFSKLEDPESFNGPHQN